MYASAVKHSIRVTSTFNIHHKNKTAPCFELNLIINIAIYYNYILILVIKCVINQKIFFQ